MDQFTGIEQADALAMFKWVYDREEHYKEQGMAPELRKEWRDKELKPSLQTMKEWMEQKIKLVPPSALIANAMNYFINEYPELTAFLENGRYEIDNGWLERTIRKFAIGRNNWMFCDTVEGAHASSLLYSLVITAKLNGKDPFQAMTQIFYSLPGASTADDYEQLAKLLLNPESPQSRYKKEGLQSIERLILTSRVEFLDHILFWNASDLKKKLGEFQNYYNQQRIHFAHKEKTPGNVAGESTLPTINLEKYSWQSYCRGLYLLPKAA